MDSDSFRQQLAAVEQKIEGLIAKKTRLQTRRRDGTITYEEEIEELVGIGTLLEKLEQQQKDYLELIKLAMKDEPPVTKSFSEADSGWIQAVTGVKTTTYRKWTEYVIDETVYPGPEFKTAFERIGKAFHQHSEAARRIFFNLFLSFIILRPEFNETLRLFTELEVTVVETNGPRKRELSGRMDYAIGFAKGMDMFDNMVAIEAKTSIGEPDLWQCVAEAAALYKTRVDAGKADKRVWGIFSNAQVWKFIFIDEKGRLWRSGPFDMDLRSYTDTEVLQVYRIVHYIVKCCYEVCETL